MKKIFIILLGVFLFTSGFIIPNISADTISLNSGGTGNVILNPGKFIEDFFFSSGCIPTTCLELGYECGSWTDGCGGILHCGVCSSGYTCSDGICIADTPGPGPGPGPEPPVIGLLIIPSVINLNLITNEESSLYQYSSLQKVDVTNLGDTAVEVKISPEGFDESILVSFEITTLNLAPGETKSFVVTFQAGSKAGNYLGEILINDRKVKVSLNVKSKLFLFDSNIVVLNKDYQVTQGELLRTQVTLIPMGDKERMDVTLEYKIKDYNNKVYLTQSETLLVEDRVDFKKNFQTGALPIGEYIVSLELIYVNGVAPSSAHFEIIEKEKIGWFGIVVWILIILILITIIVIITILILKKIKTDKEESIEE